MRETKSNNLATAELGRQAVRRELIRRGAHVTEVREGGRWILRATTASGDRTVELIIKTRRKGDWQTSIREAKPGTEIAHERRFWVFVDLPLKGTTEFFVAPDWWVRNDIHEQNQAYLARHGGERKLNSLATHHKIETARVAHGKDRWDILQL